MNRLKKALKILTVLTIISGAITALISAFLYFLAFFRKVPDRFFALVLGSGDGEMSDNRKKQRKFARDTEAWVREQEITELNITSGDGLKLHARLIPASADSDRVAVLVHGFHGSAEGCFGGIIQYYHRENYHLVLLDDRAHGRSGGKWLGFSWLDRRDIVQWCLELRKILGPEKKFLLHGVSMGAAAVMMASGEEDLPESVRVLVEDCGFSTTKEQFRHCFPKKLALLREPVIAIASLYSRIFRGYWFSEASSLRQLAKNRRPILFIHGGKDDFVPTKMVYHCCHAMQGEKALAVIPGAGHAESYSHSPESYEAALKSFTERYFV